MEGWKTLNGVPAQEGDGVVESEHRVVVFNVVSVEQVVDFLHLQELDW